MTVPAPPMLYIGTGGHNRSPYTGVAKQAVCLHIMAGTLAGCDSWFRNPQAQASANYGIGKNGEIHCYVPPEGGYFAWGNGIINQPDTYVEQLLAANPGVNPNAWSISIEHEGQSGEVPPEAMLAASAQLTAYWLERCGIPAPADESTLLGHYEFDSVNRAGCPGWERDTWVFYEELVAYWLPGAFGYNLTPEGSGGPAGG